MTTFRLDFETRSACDLRTAGARVYAKHPTTEVLIMSWALTDGGTLVARGRWFPGDPLPECMTDADEYAAHNAAFERAIWAHTAVRRYGWPPCPPAARWHCSMETAFINGVPGALERAAVAVGIAAGKDMAGHRIMLKHCKPRPARKSEQPDVLHWHDDAEERRVLYAYCDRDVDVEAALTARLPAPTALEREVMIVNRGVNDRGVRVDVDAVNGAIRIAEAEVRRLNAEVRRLTNGYVGTVDQVSRLLDWVNSNGAQLDDLRAATIRETLADEGEDMGPGAVLDVIEAEGTMPDHVRHVLSARGEAAKASVKKLRAMRAAADPDTGRIYEMFAYAAAARTARFAGRRVQLHNMVRGNPPESVPADLWYDALSTGDVEYFRTLLPELKGGGRMSVMDGLKVSTRGMLTASEGHVLLAADESQIEARVLPWLAGDGRKLDAFRRYDAAVAAGRPKDEVAKLDIYSVMAASMGYGDRQIGKVGELGCGFGASKRAIVPFARNYGFQFTEDQADALVSAWREANPLIVQFWRDEEDTAKWALEHPGVVAPRGRTGSWVYDSARDVLLRWLPSGRPLTYRRPRLERRMTPWGARILQIVYDGNIFAAGSQTSFVRVSTYGGKLAENITQAVARDVLAVGLCRAARAGLECVLHVHDEQVVDSPVEAADDHEPLLVAAMTDPIRWLPELPMASSCDRLLRYAKT